MTDFARNLPEFLQKVVERYPEVWERYQSLGKSVGDLDDGLERRDAELVRLGIAIGAGHEGSIHSHVRRCKEMGFSTEEIFHAILLSVPSVGWPHAMAVLSWAEDVLGGLSASRT